MIDVQGLSKRYGDRLAVDDLTFTVKPGIVTGFLGPNGAGKSTTMRLILPSSPTWRAAASTSHGSRRPASSRGRYPWIVRSTLSRTRPLWSMNW
jgi:ABC-2 type transport system ATP-binding protein